jgi:hypothetical protein
MEDYLHLYSEKLRTLEAMVRLVFEDRFASVQDLWQIQRDLLTFQISLQDQIHSEGVLQREVNAEIRSIVSQKPAGWKAKNHESYKTIERIRKRTEVCKHIHKISRQFGDALAYLFLKGDEKLITSLTMNQPVGFTSDRHALTGVLSIAEVFAKAGAGFPVIHDMTNILRVGDITFVAGDDEPLTVEVKTHLKGQVGDVLQLNVEVHTVTKNPDRWDKFNINIPKSDAENVSGTTQNPEIRYRPKPRLERQISRMKNARVWSEAELGKPIDIPGYKGFVIAVDLEKDSYHHDVVHELAVQAREKGHAERVTDDGLLYVAIYIDEPTDYGWPFSLEMPDVPEKTSLVAGLNAKSKIMSGHTWSHITDDTPPFVKPFFFYPLPSDLIIDVMWGRLGIFVFVGIEQLIETAIRAGHPLTLSVPGAIGVDSIPEDTQLGVLEDGQSVGGVIGTTYYKKMLHEFLSVKGFLDYLSEMARVKAELLSAAQGMSDEHQS